MAPCVYSVTLMMKQWSLGEKSRSNATEVGRVSEKVDAVRNYARPPLEGCTVALGVRTQDEILNRVLTIEVSG